MVDPLTKKGEK